MNARAGMLATAVLLCSSLLCSSLSSARPAALDLMALKKTAQVDFALAPQLDFLEFDPSGKDLLSVDSSGITLWNAESGVVRWRVALPKDPKNPEGDLSSVTLPDKSTVRLTFGSGAILVLERSSGKRAAQETFKLPESVIEFLKAQGETLESLNRPPSGRIRSRYDSWNNGGRTVTTYALLEDKNLLAYAPRKSHDEVILYDLERRKELRRIKEPLYWVNTVSLSPDGKWLALEAGSRISVWDVNTGIKRFNLRQNVYLESSGDGSGSLEWSADSKTLASIGSEFNLWNVADGKNLKHLEQSGMAWNGKELALGGAFISLRSSETGQERLKLGYTLEQTSFSPSGKQFVTRSSDGRLRLYAVDALEKPRELPRLETEYIRDIAWLEGQKQIILLSDRSLERLDFGQVPARSILVRLENSNSSLYPLQLSSKGDWLASYPGGEPLFVRLTPESFELDRPAQELPVHCEGNAFRRTLFSRDFQSALCANGNKLERLETGKTAPVWSRTLAISLDSVQLSPSEQRMAFPWLERQILIIRTQDGKNQVSIAVPPRDKDDTSLNVSRILFSVDERWIALRFYFGWRFFDLSSKKEMPAPPALSSAVNLFFTEDGRYLVAQQPDALEFYRTP